MQLIEHLKAAWTRGAGDNLGLIAAGVAFYAFLALVPTIAALVLAYGLFADPSDAVAHAARLTALLPPSAAGIVDDQMMEVASGDSGKTALGLAIALATALYGASKGGKALLVALNIIERVEESRGLVRQTLTALAITAMGVLAALGALAAISALGFAEAMVPGLPAFAYTILRMGLWLLLGLGATVSLAALYARAPNHPMPPIRGTFPGAVLATILLLVATLGFAVYVAQFGNYNATYGALGAVVVLQMWLYISAYAVLLGAEFHSVRRGL
ncbi:YihY/virulence factor BrkB family protein [Sphingomicrobium arenosum]|uniref:YihY/virulence factor BrkB family protein n=1 Tax=Sphingomicrobium arenosum TaxID=2233861 RepID=UPI0022407754|nr:YihY/virulence factor BrkB family protein [Sphingomicrobium arenosum]